VKKYKFLITGTSSGLGSYLLKELGGTPFRRSYPLEMIPHSGTYYDCIIHCATDARNSIDSEELLSYYHSHIELTNRLIQIPHRLFVFISSSAVYPDQFSLNSESDTIILPHNPPLYGLYGTFKLLTEKIIASSTSSFLILRCVTIIGPTSRSTSLVRIFRNDSAPINLSADSNFNLVSMSQIKEFIKLAISQNITGTFNAGSTKNATLQEIASALDLRPKFGKFTFNVHMMNTDKIRSISRDFDKTTLEIAKSEYDNLSKTKEA
jgi:nucleoside-diphosphate-sugar epimerase